jgi:hypothetical protein
LTRSVKLGDGYDGLQRAKGIGVILKSQTIDLKHQVKYPDCVYVALCSAVAENIQLNNIL